MPNASRILQRDVYGWFRRVSRATYALTERAARDLARFATAEVLPSCQKGVTLPSWRS